MAVLQDLDLESGIELDSARLAMRDPAERSI
jgi:hypothetical protein